MSEAPRGQRWFISASDSLDLEVLIAGLQRRGAAPYVLSDVAPLGADILHSVQQAITAADHVLVVLGDEVSPNSLFEAGIAVGLGKSVVVVADPQMRVPTDLSGLLTVRAKPDDLGAINFALDQVEGRTSGSMGAARPTGRSLGPLVDQILGRLSSTPSLMETAVLDALIQAVEESGSVAVRSPKVGDLVPDLGVWSDDLDAISANPLLIEVRQRFSSKSVRQALGILHSYPGARTALIVYLDAGDDPRAFREARFPILAISLFDLLEHMRTSSFAEVIRDLRNRSVHGVPQS